MKCRSTRLNDIKEPNNICFQKDRQPTLQSLNIMQLKLIKIAALPEMVFQLQASLYCHPVVGCKFIFVICTPRADRDYAKIDRQSGSEPTALQNDVTCSVGKHN